jgi:hypothetical protein
MYCVYVEMCEREETTMNTVSDFKRAIVPGARVTLLNADWWPAMNGVTREVVRVQSAKFSLLTVNREGEVVESWADFPKASESVVEGDTITFPRFSCRPEMGTMTYKVEG